jgi:hypothetical protein
MAEEVAIGASARPNVEQSGPGGYVSCLFRNPCVSIAFVESFDLLDRGRVVTASLKALYEAFERRIEPRSRAFGLRRRRCHPILKLSAVEETTELIPPHAQC